MSALREENLYQAYGSAPATRDGNADNQRTCQDIGNSYPKIAAFDPEIRNLYGKSVRSTASIQLRFILSFNTLRSLHEAWLATAALRGFGVVERIGLCNLRYVKI